MDKGTHEVRKQYWKGIINQCMQRPEGMTAKQWLDNNGIVEQTYYSWLKKIRQETYELATATKELPIETAKADISFAEIPVPCTEIRTVQAVHEQAFQPDITINTGSIVFGISNSASDTLLNKVFEVISHAR